MSGKAVITVKTTPAIKEIAENLAGKQSLTDFIIDLIVLAATKDKKQ